MYVDWLVIYLIDIEDEDIILVGDMNVYVMEDLICVFVDKGFKSVVVELDGDILGYFYSFFGRIGSFDYVLVFELLFGKVVVVIDWYINVDELISLDYNFEFKFLI